jgi:hypothetical protein
MGALSLMKVADITPSLQGGLTAILGPNPTSQTPAQTNDLTLRAQCFYLSRKKNIPIDFDAYKTYLASRSPAEPTSASLNPKFSNAPESLPATTQPSHPHHETDLPPASQPSPQNGKEAPYPPTFAEIVALITSGAPIPGIKEIPDTLLTEQATKPVASKRRKPWEVDVQGEDGGEVEGGIGGTFGDERDRVVVQDLPE